MNIGISTSVVQRGKTGVGQYVLSLVRAFLPYASSHRFILFVLEEDLPLFEFAQGFMTLVPVPERFRPPVRNILWHQTALPRLARAHQLDVLHVPSYRRLLWPRPCILVATIHDLAPFRVARKYDSLRMFYGKVVVRRLARRQDAIISISHNTARDILECFGLPRERVAIVHNGLDHERFFPGSRHAAKLFLAEQFEVRRPFFLYLARLEHPAKNHVRLIEAFNRFKAQTRSDWQLVFSGSDWHGADVIHQHIRQSPFAHDIRALGFVNGNELPQLYRAADAFVYPSLYEGFGLPPLEAMACGCPVISSTRGSLKEVVGDAVLEMDPDNVPQIQERLAAIAADERAREQLSRQGLERAQCFSWSKTAAETLKIFHRTRSPLNQHF